VKSADGVGRNSIENLEKRPLKGSIAKMAIQSRTPIIIDDLTQYSSLPIIERHTIRKLPSVDPRKGNSYQQH